MGAFYSAALLVVGEEGGFGQDPQDPGNWTGGAIGQGELKGTCWGISAAQYPSLDIRNLTQQQAYAVYRRDYWDRLALDSVAPGPALLLFDGAVNQGAPWMAEELQLIVGTNPDGLVGPVTLRATALMPELTLVSELCAHRAMRYFADSEFLRYGHGWLKRLGRMTALCRTYATAGD